MTMQLTPNRCLFAACRNFQARSNAHRGRTLWCAIDARLGSSGRGRSCRPRGIGSPSDVDPSGSPHSRHATSEGCVARTACGRYRVIVSIAPSSSTRAEKPGYDASAQQTQDQAEYYGVAACLDWPSVSHSVRVRSRAFGGERRMYPSSSAPPRLPSTFLRDLAFLDSSARTSTTGQPVSCALTSQGQRLKSRPGNKRKARPC